jgi:hypothetical protein
LSFFSAETAYPDHPSRENVLITSIPSFFTQKNDFFSPDFAEKRFFSFFLCFSSFFFHAKNGLTIFSAFFPAVFTQKNAIFAKFRGNSNFSELFQAFFSTTRNNHFGHCWDIRF